MENSTGKKFVPTRDKFRRGIEEGGGSLFSNGRSRNEKVKVFRVSRSSLIHTTRPRPTASHLPCPRIARVPVSRFSGVSRRKKKEKKEKCPLSTRQYIQSVHRLRNQEPLVVLLVEKIIGFEFRGTGSEGSSERRAKSRRLTVYQRSSRDFLFPLMVEIDDRMVEGKKVRDALGIN